MNQILFLQAGLKVATLYCLNDQFKNKSWLEKDGKKILQNTLLWGLLLGQKIDEEEYKKKCGPGKGLFQWDNCPKDKLDEFRGRKSSAPSNTLRI